MSSLPLLPLIALIGGILVLIKADLLNWVVAIFMIGYGVLGLLPLAGVDVSPIWEFLQGITPREIPTSG